MAATAIAAAAAAASSSSSTAVPFCKKLLHLPFEYHLLSPIPRPKPIKALKLKTVSSHTPPFSLLFRSLLTRASASAFTQQPESEPQSEQDEYSDDDDGQVQTERRLYVGNLPYAITNSELGEIFGEAGLVKSVEIVYDRVTDRSRGFGFVKMGSVEEAKEAIRMYDGSQIGGRTVRVNFPEVPRGGEREVMGPRIQNSYHAFVDSPHKLYAGNLSWNITSQGLREAFADQPGVLSTKVIYDRDTGRSRGFGFITFSSAEDAESALNAMNGVGLEGRPLRLNMADGRAVAPRQPRYSENNFNNSEMFSSFSH